MDTERLTVVFRACACPDTPHPEGDVVYLRPILGFAAGAAVLRAMNDAVVIVAQTGGGPDGKDPIIDESRSDELVGPVYVREGPTGWNVVDEDGPVPYDPDFILGDYTWAYPVVEACSALYTEAVIAPLAQRMNASFGNGRNGAPTHRTPRSPAKARSPRRSSSRNGTAGKRSAVNP